MTTKTREKVEQWKRFTKALAEYPGVSEPDGYTHCGFCYASGHTETHDNNCIVLEARKDERT